MSTFRDTMASLLRNNPTIYPEPRDAMLLLMVSQGQWVGGQWEVEGIKTNRNGMDFSDLRDRQSSHATDRLQDEIQTLQRRLLDHHMDEILKDNPTRVYFRPTFLRDFRTLELTDGKVPANAPFLDFPDDIAADWGHAIMQFHSWLEHELHSRYMLAAPASGAIDFTDPALRAHWPPKAQDLQKSIASARRRLHPLLHGGQDYDEHCRDLEALSSRLIDEIIEEERQASKSARPSP